MPTRADIGAQFGIIYTCNCGWLDRGHSLAKSSRSGIGPAALLKSVLVEQGPRDTLNDRPAFRVTYRQDAVRAFGPVNVFPGVGGEYKVRSGLPYVQKLQVALAIYIDVSLHFESTQNSALSRSLTGTDSGFSEEDLVSNLVGFYRAVNPNLDVDRLCRPVSIGASQKIWDKHGAVGSNKNRSFTPHLYACDECTDPPRFPHDFQTIKPARRGEFFDVAEAPSFGVHVKFK